MPDIRISVPATGQVYPPLPPVPGAPTGANLGALGGDPWSAYPDAPSGPAPAASLQAEGDTFSAYPDYSPALAAEAAKAPAPAMESNLSGPNAAIAGFKDMASFGTVPVVEGLQKASGLSPEIDQTNVASPALGTIRPLLGFMKIANEWLANNDDHSARNAYEQGRVTALGEQNAAQQTHPIPFLIGQLAGALAGPSFGIGTGATLLGRMGKSALAGGLGSGLYGTGTAISENKSGADIAKAGLENAATGAVFGGVTSAGLSAAERGATAISRAVRGGRDVDAEAARKVVSALQADYENVGPRMSPQEIAAANKSGVPRAIIDLGADETHALAHAAANVSPAARGRLTEFTNSRFENQSSRIADFVRNYLGSGAHAALDEAALRNAARAANKPAYQLAYRAGDRQIWSPELERLTSAPAVEQAFNRAKAKWKDYQVADGFGALSPPVNVNNGVVTKGGTGIPVYPNLQLWDYVARELQDAAREAAPGSGAAQLYNNLARQLKTELDRLVPEYQNARTGAARFFGALDALDAGKQFVMSNSNIQEARAALSKMSSAERELFARGFASELADRIERAGFNRNVLNSAFLNSRAARQKIVLALGPQRTLELEAQLRAEAIIDEARKALQGSSTTRQLVELGLTSGGAGGAVAAYEGFKENSFNPSHIIAVSLGFGAIKRGAQVIDQRVAKRVGELLTSNDPRLLAKGLKIVARTPAILDAFRAATGATSNVAARDIGPQRALAGTAAISQKMIGGRTNPSAFSDQILDQAQQ